MVVVREFLCIVCGDVREGRDCSLVEGWPVRRCLGGCAGIARREADRCRGGDGPGSIFSFHKRKKDFILPVHGVGGARMYNTSKICSALIADGHHATPRHSTRRRAEAFWGTGGCCTGRRSCGGY